MSDHLPVDMTLSSITCSCGRVIRLSAEERAGLVPGKVQDALLDRLSDHNVSMKEQGR